MISAVATWKFGQIAVNEAVIILKNGGSAVEAVEKGINAVELDTKDQYYVGVGGFPNRNGIMELDAAIMDHELRYGAVMALKEISRPVSVATTILEDCPHNVLVGDGALSWALEHGFEKENILTRRMEKEFYEWKLSHFKESSSCDENPDETDENTLREEVSAEIENENHDTIGMICLDKNGRLCAGSSTSGYIFHKYAFVLHPNFFRAFLLRWRYKYPGRIGDSPIIGCGLYCDGEVGAAVATGDGEEVRVSRTVFILLFHF
jgi:N4-(beta-N-acetylglucosaminyl)-L-asparaginase